MTLNLLPSPRTLPAIGRIENCDLMVLSLEPTSLTDELSSREPIARCHPT